MVVGNEWWVVFLQNIQLVLRIWLKVHKTLVWQVLHNLSLACLLRSDLAELSKQRGSTTFLMSVSAKKQIENWIIKYLCYLFKKYSEKKTFYWKWKFKSKNCFHFLTSCTTIMQFKSIFTIPSSAKNPEEKKFHVKHKLHMVFTPTLLYFSRFLNACRFMT